jgi:SAM-dependent methyltransferase
MSSDLSISDASSAIEWYDSNAEAVVARHESLAPEQVNAWLKPFLPNGPALVLDVGAGSGRDSAWLVSLGHEVIAVEPSAPMRDCGQRLHPSEKIRWINDRLPGLEKIHSLGLSFDFILLNAVWMHLAPTHRQRAFRKLITLLKPGGWIAFTFRQPEPNNSRSMYPCHADELEQLARIHGSFIETRTTEKDPAGQVEWTRLTVRLPDDGTGALPVIRHIILKDSKSSTYLQARIAAGASSHR